jgi:hypothetical protein
MGCSKCAAPRVDTRCLPTPLVRCVPTRAGSPALSTRRMCTMFRRDAPRARRSRSPTGRSFLPASSTKVNVLKRRGRAPDSTTRGSTASVPNARAAGALRCAPQTHVRCAERHTPHERGATAAVIGRHIVVAHDGQSRKRGPAEARSSAQLRTTYSVPGAARQWAEHNGCSTSPSRSVVAPTVVLTPRPTPRLSRRIECRESAYRAGARLTSLRPRPVRRLPTAGRRRDPGVPCSAAVLGRTPRVASSR